MFLSKLIYVVFCVNLILFSSVDVYAEDNQTDQKVKGSLVVVGDAMLTYSSYFFVLPENWIPDIDSSLLALTNQKGFWRGKHKNGDAWILIAPTKTEGKNSEFIKTSKDVKALGGCSLNNYNFSPVFTYSYESYLEYCPKTGVGNRYGLIVFAKLPAHVINFNLYVKGEKEDCLIPYLEDFNKVIASFRWTLGLNDDEIGGMLKDYNKD